MNKLLLLAAAATVSIAAHAGTTHTVEQAITAAKLAGTACPKIEQGKVTKVEVIDAAEVKKRTHGGMKAAPGNYLVIHSAKVAAKISQSHQQRLLPTQQPKISNR